MPSDISSVTPAAPATPPLPKASAASAPSTAPAIKAPAPQASPVSLLDPSTGLVVLEFYNAKGDETESLPTRKQLDSYRLNETSGNIYQPAIHDVAIRAEA